MPSRLTIRTRVALWCGAVIVAVLLVVGLAVSVVYQRIGLARVDMELEAAMRTLDGVVIDELHEESTLPAAAAGALRELDLPGVGVAIVAPDGTVLARRASGVAAVPDATVRHERVSDAPRTLSDLQMRIDASEWRHEGVRYTIVAWTALAPLARERATLQNTMLVAMPIAALAAMIGGWLIGRWALRPLTAMAADASAIDHRRLDARLPSSNAGDELGRLGAAFNAVLDRLAVVVEAQRRFMAEASHELRTPVSIARTAAQVTLSAPGRTEAEYRESLDIIAAQMRRLTRVVGDMFTLALADLNARPLQPTDFYLNELVSDCARAAKVLAAPRHITIHVEGEAVDVPAHGDEGLLRQLVMNLLDNAVRHAPDAGQVRVSLEHDDRQAALAVEDSGPGVPAGDQTRVFERFVRLGPPGSTGGAGLGLSIAHWIAEQHGGSLRVVGDGQASSRFVLTLPLLSDRARGSTLVG